MSVNDEGIHLQTMIHLQAKLVVQMQAGILPSKLKKSNKRDLIISVFFFFFPVVNMIHFYVGRGVDES